MLTTLIEGLGFAEGLRWRDNALWFSDFISRKVQSVDERGNLIRQGFVAGQPSGLGFSTSGEVLAVSMLDRKLARLETDHLELVTDLSEVSQFPCNDMLVDQDNNVYISTFSYDYWYQQIPNGATSPLIHIDAEGKANIAADGLHSPNGIVRLPNSNTLIVAETGACRLTAFDIGNDGKLANRRLFADLGEIHPDGLCTSREGHVWVAGLYANQFLLVDHDGKIIQRISTGDRWAVSCALGGTQGNRLFCATTSVSGPNDLRQGLCKSHIEYIDIV